MALKVNGVQYDELTADPGSPVEGQTWYNTTDQEFRIYRNAIVQTIIFASTMSSHVADANPHTVTLEQARTANNVLAGDVNMGGNKLTNMAAPTAPSDAATQQFVKDQVDSKLQGWDWQESVLDRDLTTPPGSPATGDRYIVAAVAAGAWTGQEDSIAEWDGSQWVFSVPDNGTATIVEDEGVNGLAILWNGTSWGSFGDAVDHGALVGLGDDDHTQYLLVSGARAMTGDLDMGANNVTNVGTVDGVDVSTHAARHIDGGADPIDFDRGEVTYIPTNYTRTTVPAEVDQLDQLTAHLAGIDNQLTAAGLQTKAGRVLNASFAGNPKTATVTFSTAFGTANYSVTVTPVTTGGTAFTPFVESKIAASFVINMGANNIAALTEVGWHAILDGETV